jgi:hypothetical protein
MFDGLIDSINNIREEQAKKSLPLSVKERYAKLVFDFTYHQLGELHNTGYTSVNKCRPGPYFIAWYKKSNEREYLNYKFSYVKNILESKAQSLLKDRIIAYIGDVDLDKGVLYVGEILKKPPYIG